MVRPRMELGPKKARPGRADGYTLATRAACQPRTAPSNRDRRAALGEVKPKARS